MPLALIVNIYTGMKPRQLHMQSNLLGPTNIQTI